MVFSQLVALCLWAVLVQTARAFYPGNTYYQNNLMSLAIPMEGPGYNQFSTCFYVSLRSPIPVTQQIPVLSYLAGDVQTAQIVFQLEYERQMSSLFIGGGKGSYFSMVPRTNQWTHICLTWDGYLGLVNAYVDGVPTGMANGIQTGYRIPGQGVWNVGQSQLDVGQVSQLHFWDRVISNNEVQQALDCSLSGNVLAWDSSAVEYEGLKNSVSSSGYQPYPCMSGSKSCPEHATTSSLDRDNLDVGNDTYIIDGLLDKKLPRQKEVSFCAWLYSEEGTELHPLAVKNEDDLEIFALFVHDDGSLGLHVGGTENKEEQIFPKLKIEYYKWDHYCITWSGRDGKSQVFLNGHLKHLMRDVMTGYSIPAGNKLWVKQLQYDNANADDTTQGFSLKIVDVNWWDHVVTKDEVSQVYSCSGSLPGNIFSWNTDILEFYDMREKEVCQQHATTSSLDRDDLVVGNDTYIVDGLFDKKLPKQKEVSFCAWLYSEEGTELHPVAVKNEDDLEMFAMIVLGNGSLGLHVGGSENNEERIFPNLKFEYYQWDHYCVTWSGRDGESQVFVNGRLKHLMRDIMTSYSLPAGNKLWVKQLQYGNADADDPTTGFALKITNVNWWDHVVTEDEVSKLYSCSGSLPGDVISWNIDKLEFNDVRQKEMCLGPVTTSFMDLVNTSIFTDGKACSVMSTQIGENSWMKNFSLCFWSFLSSSGKYPQYDLLAAATSKSHYPIEFILVDQGMGYLMNEEDPWLIDFARQKNTWYHECLSFENENGELRYYVNGEFLSNTTTSETGIVVATSKLNLIQYQTEAFDPAEPTKGFMTKITATNLWDYVITNKIVHDAYCGNVMGNMVNKTTEFLNPEPTC